MNVLDHKLPHHKYFEEISRIPRASFKEERCADYLVEFAIEHNLAYKRDEINNVILYKPASPGYESHDPVLLQGHTDMVCEKVEGCSHDFDTEPICLYKEDNILRARGTTLGADNAVGCAYMLAVLALDIPHPALECVFTVREEVGFLGALALKADDFKATRYINLDFGGGGVGTCVASAGGELISLQKAVAAVTCADRSYRVIVRGLKGGHSGSCIHLERGNAIKICGRILKKISECCNLRIVRLHGGDKNNAIPRMCEAVFSSSTTEQDIQRVFDTVQTQIRQEISLPEPDFETILERTESTSAFTEQSSMEILNLLCLLPTGLRHKSLQFETLPTVSENLASVRCIGNQMEIQYSLRANKISLLNMMETELHVLADMFGMSFCAYNRYPPWEAEPNSKLRETVCSRFKARRGVDMTISATHGGLECGVFTNMLPGLDAVTLGAATANVHTPEEQLDLASFDWSFELLVDVLKAL